VARFTTEPSFYILQHSYDMLVRIACSGQHRGVHTPERKHHIRRHTDYRTALKIGCPSTSAMQMSNKQQHIVCSFAHSLPSS
jgi:hypothetical protein